ncbi:MAG: hypothetical protein LBF62_13915 [Tannerellaceae bacterium]|nr:hypothetical protein [Tannerellaceae bacterium]
MKEKLSIVSIAIASFILLAFAVVSHHHHEGLPCIVTEHSGLPGGEEGTCIVESEYTAPRATGEIKCRIVSFRDYDSGHLFPAFFLAADSQPFAMQIPPSGNTCGKHILLLCKSSEANRFHGLRAPPSVIS